MPSKVPVVEVRHAACAKSTCVKSTRAKSTSVNSAEAGDVTSAKAADVGTADAPNVAAAHAPDAAHVAATKAAAMATAAATATSGLRAGRNQASGEHCTCQNHHRSSFHDILHLDGRMFRLNAWSGIRVSQQSER